MRITTMAEIVINKRHCLVAGLSNGALLTLVFRDKKLQATSCRNDHIKSITSLSVSPCNKYAISCGADCMIFIYESSLFLNSIKQ